ncbi:MAG: HAMP domain-containing histidine kinase [Actinobacteria bacterium]|nr:HAMP domain-containing histidine kinase [Actinomycetota bacterium]
MAACGPQRQLRTPIAIVHTAASTALVRHGDDVSEALRDILEMIRRNADLASLLLGRLGIARDIEAVTVSGAPSVRADPTAAREIVFNLLSNAAKYSSSAAPIEVTVGAVGDIVEVVVRDHGSGVTQGTPTPSSRSPGRGTGPHRGWGSGCTSPAVSRGRKGGDITVQPAAHEGSEFRLPLLLST